MIGGYAMAAHGLPRYTKDIDVWVHTNRDNANRIKVTSFIPRYFPRHTTRLSTANRRGLFVSDLFLRIAFIPENEYHTGMIERVVKKCKLGEEEPDILYCSKSLLYLFLYNIINNSERF